MLRIFTVLFIGCLQITLAVPKHKIHIGCLVPSYRRDYYGYVAAINLAAEMINNRSDILPNHEIVMLCRDTYGSPPYTISRVNELLQLPANQSIRLLIGPASYDTTVAASQTSSLSGIVQLSYAESSVEFQEGGQYYYLFTNAPSTSAFNKASLSLIQHFGWKRVAILRESGHNFHVDVFRDDSNISLITIEVFSRFSKGHPRKQLENLQRLDARIIIGEFSTRGAVDVFCEAHKIGMIGPKYVWLLPGASSRDVESALKKLSESQGALNCNVSEILEAGDGMIVYDKVHIRADNGETLSGLTPDSFMAEMRKRNEKPETYVSYAFDSVWAAALLFQTSLSGLKQFHPENAEFGSRSVANFYANILSRMQFQGMTGPHHFDDNRQRLGSVQISQVRSVYGAAEVFQIGLFSSINRKEFKVILFESEVNKLWKGGKVPVDEARKERKVLTYSILQLVVIGTLAVLGMFYSIFFFYFNISKRKHKVVRMSSPMINNVVLFGCFFCYIFVFLLGIDSRFVNDHVLGILCNVRLYVLPIAFSMSFGALFSKTWRVYKIFTAQRAIKKKMMRDVHLILFVFAVVIVDVIFVTIWVSHDPMETKEMIFDQQRDDFRDVITFPVLKTCESTHGTKLLAVLYGYKGIPLLFGVFLSWVTRNVTIPALNDSKYIGLSVYNVVILSAIGATVSLVFNKTAYYELLHVLVSSVVLLSTTVTLTVVFAPKVYEYYLIPPEPKGSTRTMKSLQMSASRSNNDGSDVYDIYVKAKDVKNKWTQTDDLDQVMNNAMLIPSPTLPGQNVATAANHGSHSDNNGETLTSGVNVGGESVSSEKCKQNDGCTLIATGSCTERRTSSTESSEAVANGGFNQDYEDVKVHDGSHVDSKL